MTQETKSATRNDSRWNKLIAPLVAVGAAISYDPREQADAVIKEIGHKLELLESRVQELEQ